MTEPLTAWRAFALYVVASLAMSWPLPMRLTTAMPGDLGDPLLNAWILVWGFEHANRFLSGDIGAFASWWNANIFHPSPLALAYSEHLAPEVLAGLPLWWLSHNVLLVYNVLFLASAALSGLGMFLLVRELTGQARAALVAGLFYAFVPYRIAQTPHLQVLWWQWMPFVLYGLRCYFERGRTIALAGALAALVVQQLSCGYYLIYFTPFVAVYAIWEVTTRSRWRDWRLLGALAAAVAVDLAIVWPFVQPYLQLRALGFPPRSLIEVARYSADTTAYLAAHGTNRVWGPILKSLARPENELFPGLVPIAMAVVGIAGMGWSRWADTRSLASPSKTLRRLSAVGFLMAVTAGAGLITVLLTGGVTWRLGRATLFSLRSVDRSAVALAGGLLLLVAASPRARAWCRWGNDVRGCALLLLAIAVVLSWGPAPRAGGVALSFTGPYWWLYEYVPGFDGLRVPARLATISYLFLAVMAGYGVAAVDRLRHGWRWATLAGTLFLVEATGVPLPIAENMSEPGVATPPPQVFRAAEAPDVYARLAEMPEDIVIAEFPFGFSVWELRYVFYSSVHLRPLVNGFSGGFPEDYIRRSVTLRYPLESPDRAWRELQRAGVTHVVVHREAFVNGQDVPVMDWLQRHGARPAGTYGSDELVTLPR